MPDLKATLRTVAAAAICVAFVHQARAETQLERGHYLVDIMDCGGCHTTGSLLGKPQPAKYLAGAEVGWAFPGVIVYPRNITPDKETGIGDWSEKDIIKLLRTGARPDGREVMPIMNWRAYSHLSDSDVEAVAAYLKSVPAVQNVVAGPTPFADVKTPYFTIAGQ